MGVGAVNVGGDRDGKGSKVVVVALCEKELVVLGGVL